jgi:hypothetical protein
MILGLLLLPVCMGAGWTVVLIFQASGHADTIWIAMISGALCWVIIYWLLPKPMWIYVFGHELTHAIWVWAMGGRVKKFKASSKGGHVIVTKSNFLIALAPYFFPVYAVLVVLVFCAGHWLWNWRHYLVWFHLLLGAAYAFHVTLTWHILKHEQSDLSQQGYFFSAVIIFLGNILVLLLGIPLLTSQVGVETALRWWLERTREIILTLGRLF